MGHWDVSLVVKDKVGALAEVGEAYGKAGINIEGLWTHTRDSDAHVHLLVTDLAAAEKVAKEGGWTVHRAHEVLVEPVENKPGWLGRQCRALADAGLNVEWTYLATDNRVVVSVKDLAAARKVWQGVSTAAR